MKKRYSRKCFKCGKEKYSGMNLIMIRRLGIQAKHNSKVGYTKPCCDDCLKELNLYEEIPPKEVQER